MGCDDAGGNDAEVNGEVVECAEGRVERLSVELLEDEEAEEVEGLKLGGRGGPNTVLSPVVAESAGAVDAAAEAEVMKTV